ncbi:cupin domain-containing protein [Mycobacterium sp. ITM-2016-00316]|uniref:cupin domain-containing protein n=1 Tax=Mycobacterium sp. ITM-2016-00316 TaxID=2099695 RepID=UPI001E610191|nr:cupin domain-containing protein [Mycobacterium sp. ITM-2016-00316]WNG83460.1 cupin domain-containing protein [Mycobacterium sp. ITM-2016-00316]
MSRRDNKVGSGKAGYSMVNSGNPATVLLGKAGDSPAYWYRGVLWNVLLSANQTRGEFTFIEQIIPAGAGPPAHIHERQAEGFYILSGEIEFVVGEDEVVRAGPGSVVWVPKSTRHAFRVISDEDARVLNFYAPGGFDDHLPFYGVEATVQTLPPADLGVSELDRERQGASQERRDAYLQRLADIAEGTWDFTMPDPNQK